MRRLVLLLGLVGLLAVIFSPLRAATQAPSGPLDGSAWSVKVTPDAAAAKKGEKPFDDVIVFRGGKVAMSECVKAGFAASSYATEKTDDGWTFKTEQTSKKAGKSKWTGEVKGSAIKGTMVSTKKDGTVLSYTFEGAKAGK